MLRLQQSYFRTGATLSVQFRKRMLTKLYNAVKAHTGDLEQALKKDMNKSYHETYMTEIGLVLGEIRYHMDHLAAWARPRHVLGPVSELPSIAEIVARPYGCALIISPWNYPVNLTLQPLIGAISAGCTAVVKMSEYSNHTTDALASILGETFAPEYISVVKGGADVSKALLRLDFDKIFFTGNKRVGREVLRAAADHLTPVTLELGGKSPVIVDGTADIETAARRIAFGKVLNAGQTCVAPDYLLIKESVKDEFVEAYRKAIKRFFPDGDYSSMNSIIDARHFERAARLMGSGEAVVGGRINRKRRSIEPTLLDHVSLDSPIMNEEVFAPILPMLTYKHLDTAIDYIRSGDKPLAVYLFTRNKKVADKVLRRLDFGGCCINDTIVHMTSADMPFGGVGGSGMGSYHGKYSFMAFSHTESILKKTNVVDIPLRYRPYTKFKRKLVRAVLK